MSTVTFTSSRLLIPEESKAVLSSEASPVSVVMEPASMIPVVLSSSVLRTAALREVSERVTASLPRPVMPTEEKALSRSMAAPASVVTAAASMATVVFASSVLRAAASTEASSMVME